ncbi:hypothetical protein C2E23DRAFT_740538, partial [Lenzites betulinus]
MNSSDVPGPQDEDGHAFRVTLRRSSPEDIQEARRTRRQRRKQRRLYTARADKIQARDAVTIPPSSSRLVPVVARFPKNSECLYVERIRLFATPQQNEFYGAPDTILRKGHATLPIANFSDRPVRIERGEVLGIAHDPHAWLDKLDRYTHSDQIQIHAHAKLLRSLANGERSLTAHAEAPELIRSDAATISEDPLAEEPVEGGPKTSEIPPDDTPKELLSETIDISADLTKEQRESLLSVIQRNESAFALDGRLGTVNAECTIPLRPGSKEVSLPPFPSSPAKREVM